MTIKTLPLDTITADPRAQPRAALDPFLIDDYADAMRAGTAFPPVTVFAEGDEYYLADGFHRLAAAREAGLETIQAEVREGGLRAAILHAVGANATHGARRTNADKRRAVLILLGDPEWSRWSDRQIARQAAVSNRFVSTLRASVNGSQMERQVARGGQVYMMKTTAIGAARKLAPEVRDLLRETAIADDSRQIARLGARPNEVQVRVAEKIAAGEARSVHEAFRQLAYDEKTIVSLAEAELGRFPVLYADPPWDFDSGDGLEGAAAEQYPTLLTEGICDLPVLEKTAEDAVLFLWTTNTHLPAALRVLDAWGFVYKSNLVWLKERLGLGFYFRGQHELLLCGVKGSMLPREAVPSVLSAAGRGHSRKPEEVYELIERMYPGMRYLELFARKESGRPGWVAWGNEPALVVVEDEV